MAKDDEWTTVTKKERTGRPKEATTGASPTGTGSNTIGTIGGSGGQSIYKKGLRMGHNASGSASDGPVQKKYGAGSNKQRQQASIARKADQDDLDSFHLEKVPRAVGLAITQARQKKNISREDLARAINEKATVVADVENGKALMNNALIAKIEKALGARVRG